MASAPYFTGTYWPTAYFDPAYFPSQGAGAGVLAAQSVAYGWAATGATFDLQRASVPVVPWGGGVPMPLRQPQVYALRAEPVRWSWLPGLSDAGVYRMPAEPWTFLFPAGPVAPAEPVLLEHAGARAGRLPRRLAADRILADDDDWIILHEAA